MVISTCSQVCRFCCRQCPRAKLYRRELQLQVNVNRSGEQELRWMRGAVYLKTKPVCIEDVRITYRSNGPKKYSVAFKASKAECYPWTILA